MIFQFTHIQFSQHLAILGSTTKYRKPTDSMWAMIFPIASCLPEHAAGHAPWIVFPLADVISLLFPQGSDDSQWFILTPKFYFSPVSHCCLNPLSSMAWNSFASIMIKIYGNRFRSFIYNFSLTKNTEQALVMMAYTFFSREQIWGSFLLFSKKYMQKWTHSLKAWGFGVKQTMFKTNIKIKYLLFHINN